jgi:uncharacterized protein (DUF2132 family)
VEKNFSTSFFHIPLHSITFLAMSEQQSNDPLHGKTLEAILLELVDYYGWGLLGKKIRINCFTSNPSIQSSLKFLRKTPWARKKVEELYIQMIKLT